MFALCGTENYQDRFGSCLLICQCGRIMVDAKKEPSLKGTVLSSKTKLIENDMKAVLEVVE